MDWTGLEWIGLDALGTTWHGRHSMTCQARRHAACQHVITSCSAAQHGAGHAQPTEPVAAASALLYSIRAGRLPCCVLVQQWVSLLQWQLPMTGAATHIPGPFCTAASRYYVADGVRLYCQDTWRLVMGNDGRSKVAQFVAPLVVHYIEQSKASNHAAREAACACIAGAWQECKP